MKAKVRVGVRVWLGLRGKVMRTHLFVGVAEDVIEVALQRG